MERPWPTGGLISSCFGTAVKIQIKTHALLGWVTTVVQILSSGRYDCLPGLGTIHLSLPDVSISRACRADASNP